MTKKKGQVSFEYIILMGFVTFIITGILGLAFIYSNKAKDKVKVTQMQNCINKIISNAEAVFYAGYPSKTTIQCFMPYNIKNIYIYKNELYVNFTTSSGLNSVSFSSNVPINGTLSGFRGLKKIEIKAYPGNVTIKFV